MKGIHFLQCFCNGFHIRLGGGIINQNAFRVLRRSLHHCGRHLGLAGNDLAHVRIPDRFKRVLAENAFRHGLSFNIVNTVPGDSFQSGESRNEVKRFSARVFQCRGKLAADVAPKAGIRFLINAPNSPPGCLRNDPAYHIRRLRRGQMACLRVNNQHVRTFVQSVKIVFLASEAEYRSLTPELDSRIERSGEIIRDHKKLNHFRTSVLCFILKLLCYTVQKCSNSFLFLVEFCLTLFL